MSAVRLARFAAVALLAISCAHAQDSTETRLREALRETAEKLHATEADLAQQQLATAAAERERDALKQAPHPAKPDGALQHKLAEATGELAQARADQQKWQAAQQTAEQIAQKKEAERAALAEQLTQLRARVERCAANDDALYGTGREIAALYRDPKFVEPVSLHHLWPLGFDRVKEENRVRALEDRLGEQLALAQRCRNDATAPAKAPAAASTAPVPSAAATASEPVPSDAEVK
jgi:hypothetical protein